MALPLGSFFTNFFKRFLNDTPPFYPLFANYMLNRKTPILVDINDLLAVYLSCPHLRIVIDKKAEMFKNMDIRMRDTRTGEDVQTHPILTLLRTPNPLQIQEEFLAQLSIYRDIYANAFIYQLKPSSTADPKVLWNLPAGDIEVIPTGKIFQQSEKTAIIEKYNLINADGGIKQSYDVDSIIQMSQGVSYKYIVGESKILSLRLNISNIDGALRTRNVIINEKGAIGILSSSSKDSDGGLPLNPKERERIEREYRSKYGLGDDQMKIIMSTADLKWNPMTFPTKDLMLFEEVEDDFQAILGAYGMARDIFPSTKGATFENQQQAFVQTYQNTIQPDADWTMRLLSKAFSLEQESKELYADYSWLPIMQEDKNKEESANKTKADRLSVMLRDGIISPEAYAEQMEVDFTGTPSQGNEPIPLEMRRSPNSSAIRSKNCSPRYK